MFRFVTIIIIFGIFVTSVQAQDDNSSFLIRFFGAEDSIAPTTPTASGLAVASTQIDVSWTAATDNFLVSGYVLFRDGLPFATTTQTSYSDVGLAASTMYSYFVRAFDPSFNYSSSSNIVSITTPNNPAPIAPGSSSSGGTVARVVLNSLDIKPTERTALFSINTVKPARFDIRWGRTGSYELGYTVNDVYVSSYKTTLTDLEPGTMYEYEVIGYTPLGNQTILEKGKFSTISLSDSFPPTNVQAFTALRDGSNVQLNWRLPQEADVASIRIVRSHLRFPTHIQDGVVVYQGLGTTFKDADILSRYSPVYYSAFVVDEAGNVSSGSLARVYALKDGVSDEDVIEPQIPSGVDGDIKEETIASTSPNVPAGTKMPSLEEIFLHQNNTRQSLSVHRVILGSDLPFLLSIPKQSISENLKTIVASLTDPTDSRKIYSFMLRLNKDQTAYEAVLPPVMLEGKSRLIVDIYDYDSLVVANYQKTIEFKKNEKEVGAPIFPDIIIASTTNFWWVYALMVFLSFVLILKYRRRI